MTPEGAPAPRLPGRWPDGGRADEPAAVPLSSSYDKVEGVLIRVS
jgi:hypothetical protein